jgi:adenine-specific DNA-methyltransferase
MPTLDWIGKKAVLNHHNEVPFHLLRCDPDLSVGEASGNLLVQGDNLLALKALLPYYAGQVKCIYIDPPYNTGNESWSYNDNVNGPEMREWLGKVVGGEAEDLSRHDKWLCMMYPRLVLLREMMRDDGAIFISIDDVEIANLRVVMDEIFGRLNFVECITWNKRIPKNDAGIGNIHEYVLVYRKNSSWKYQFTMAKDGIEKVWQMVEGFKSNSKDLSAAEKELRLLYKSENFDRGITLYNSLDNNYRPWGKINLSWPNANTFGPRYDILHPSTRKPVKVPDRGWRWKEETFIEKLGDQDIKKLDDGSYIVGQVWFDKDEKTQPSLVKYLDEVDRILLRSVISLKSDGGIELEKIFGSKAKFAYPKPTSLLQILIGSLEMNDGDIVLDPFAGSGTTAHAVLKQNLEDGINRRFLLIEIDNNILREITTERVKYVINKFEKSIRSKNGFRFCELGPTLFDADGQIRSEVSFLDLARHVFFTETGQPLPTQTAENALLGVHQGSAVYLLYNGVMKDAGNVLTPQTLAALPAFDGPKVIYADGCKIGRERLRDLGITFKQIPYEVKVR